MAAELRQRLGPWIPVIPPLILLGTALHLFVSAPHGYVATDAFPFMWLFSLVIILLGLILIAIKSKRRSGVVLVLSTILANPVFYLVCLLLAHVHALPWEDKQRVVISSTDSKNLLYYYERGVSYEAKRAFEDSIMSVPRKDGRGYGFHPGVRSRFSVRSGDGFEGYAYTFDPDITAEERRNILERVKGGKLVRRYFLDTVPEKIESLE